MSETTNEGETGRDELPASKNDSTSTSQQPQQLQDSSIVEGESPILAQAPPEGPVPPPTKLDASGGSGSSLKSGQSVTVAAGSGEGAVEGEQRQSQKESGGDGGGSSSSVDGSGREEQTATCSIFLQTAAYLLDVHALKVGRQRAVHTL